MKGKLHVAESLKQFGVPYFGGKKTVNVLCLCTNAMKAPNRGGDKAPGILNLTTRWSRVLTFILQSLCF